MQRAAIPKAEVMLMIAPAIQKLIEAAAGTAPLPAHAN